MDKRKKDNAVVLSGRNQLADNLDNLLSLEWHINVEGMSGYVINDLLQYAHISDKFLGIITYAELPPTLQYVRNLPPEFHMIINIGFHFVAFYATPHKLYYIDSLGHPPPPNSPVERFLVMLQNERNTSLTYNKNRIQSLQSSHCGLYASLFVLNYDTPRNRRVNDLSFYVDNSEMLRMNDDLCVLYLKSIINARNK